MSGQRRYDGPVRASIFTMPVAGLMWAIILGGVIAAAVAR